jgi:catechol 2,3-dioxygenase-like lactoylglutathione lyase family enzyme
MTDHPRLLQTVLDSTDPRGLAEFYRELLGLRYRDGDEPRPDGSPDGSPDEEWLVLVDPGGPTRLAFQRVDRLEPTTWPDHTVPMQLHLDMTVPGTDGLERQRARAQALGARLVLDRSDDAEEPLYVLADPSGHPFCIFVSD